jgi:hypothetical protein
MKKPLLPAPISDCWLLCVGLACMGACCAAVAQDTNRVVKPDYASFRIVTERNIFNANRSGGSVRPSRGPRSTSKVDAFRLVGVMAYDKGSFAFFDGSSSDYKKALQTQGKIAGYTVTQVAANAVALDLGGKKIELRVGMQMRREDNGEWQVAASGDIPAASSSASAASETGGGEPSGDVSDVLKRLMEQKEKE